MHRFVLATTLALAFALGGPIGCNNEPQIDPAEAAARLKMDLASARVLLKDGNLDKATAIYQKVLEQEPKNADAIFGMGRVHYAQEQFDKALTLLQQAAAAKPDDPEYQFYLGECLRIMEKPAEAAVAYGKAFELDAENGEYGLWYGKALKDAKKYEQAEEVLRKVAEIDVQATFVFTELGDVLREQGKTDEALIMYMKAQNVHPGDRMAHAGAAFVYEDKGDIKHALDEWSAYIRMDCCSKFSVDVAKKKLTELTEKSQAGEAG